MTRNERLVDLLRQMVQTKSYSGEEQAMAALCKARMEAYGFDEVTIVKHGSVLGCIHGTRPGKKLLFDGHMDTVEVEDAEQWKYDPFGGVIADGRLYGRGSVDMKGGDAAMIEAAARFLEDHGRDFAGDIYIACSVHEECFEGMSCREITKLVRPDYVVCPEPTGMKLFIGQMGRAEVILETEGISCHTCNPEVGINAVVHMVALLDEVFKIEPKVGPVGKGILELTDIKSAPYPGASTVPSSCRATFDRRFLPGETREDVLGPIEEAIAKTKKKIPELKARVSLSVGKADCWDGTVIEAERFFPGWSIEKTSEFAATAGQAMQNAGVELIWGCERGCTNNSHYAGEEGIPAIICGPGLSEVCHIRDEYCGLDQLQAAAEFYENLMKRILL